MMNVMFMSLEISWQK